MTPRTDPTLRWPGCGGGRFASATEVAMIVLHRLQVGTALEYTRKVDV